MKEQWHTHNSGGSFIFGLVVIFLETNYTLRVASNHLPRTKVSRKGDGTGALYNMSLPGTDLITKQIQN